MRRTTAGFLAFVSSFAVLASLSASGVEPESPEDAQCSVAQPVDAQIHAEIDRLRQQQRLEAVSQQSGDVIVLNNRGYNYGPPQGMQLDQIRAEARSGH